MLDGSPGREWTAAGSHLPWRARIAPMSRPLLVLALLACCACGRVEESPRSGQTPAGAVGATPCLDVPGCEEARAGAPAATETLWRVEVVRTAQGALRIGRTGAIAVAAGVGVPIGASSGPHVLAVVDRAGTPLDGQYVRLPENMRAEYADGWTAPRLTPTSGRDVSTVVHVRPRPGAARLVLFDEHAREVATAALPSSSVGLDWRARPWAPLLDVLEAPMLAQGPGFRPPAHCGQMVLLEGEADRDWATSIPPGAQVDLVVPGPTQRAVLEGALGLMTPLLCHGFSRVAFGRMANNPGVGGIVWQLSVGDLVVLNELVGFREEELAASREARLRLMHTILHEAAHASEALLNAEGARPQGFVGGWRPPSRELAEQTIDRVRLRKSLITEWIRVQETFTRHGLASAYPASPEERAARREWSADRVVRAGVMSRYGATLYADDIADMVAWTYMAPHYRAAGIPDGVRQTEDYACQQFRTHTEHEVPGRFAAAYTKLLFLQDLGLVKSQDVQTCVGKVGLPGSGSGFEVWQGGERRNSHDAGVQARIGTLRDRYVYEMNAEGRAEFGGKMYPSTMRLQLDLDAATTPLDEVAWPRGIYELGLLKPNKFQLRLDGAKAGSFDVHDGFALVAEASNTRIAGSVFVRVGFRLGAPLPVPQTFNPPALIRFRIEK